VTFELSDEDVQFLIEVMKRLRGSPIVPQAAREQAKQFQQRIESQLQESVPTFTDGT
jgi:hypothetical protein